METSLTTCFEARQSFEAAKTSQDSLLIENVLLRGKSSANGYDFAEGCCDADIYENVHVLLDHGSVTGRSVRDLAGWITNPRMVEGQPRGDIQLMDNEAGRTFKNLAESKPPALGMSHVAACTRNKAGTLVEKVHKVFSVDLVLNPATTKSLHEQTKEPQMDAEIKAMFEAKQKELEDKVKGLEADLAEAKQSCDTVKADLASVQKENSDLKLKVDEFEAKEALAEAKASALEAITKAGLDLENKTLCSDVFVQSIVEAEADQRDKLIADRVALKENLKAPAKHGSKERKQESTEFDADKHLARFSK